MSFIEAEFELNRTIGLVFGVFGRLGYFGEDFGPYRLLNLDSSQVDRLTYMAISLGEALTAWAGLGKKIGVVTVPTSNN